MLNNNSDSLSGHCSGLITSALAYLPHLYKTTENSNTAKSTPKQESLRHQYVADTTSSESEPGGGKAGDKPNRIVEPSRSSSTATSKADTHLETSKSTL